MDSEPHKSPLGRCAVQTAIRRAASALFALGLASLGGGTVVAHAEAAPGVVALSWNEDWSRFRPWEYAATAATGAGSYYVRYHLLGSNEVKWQGHNSFDDTIRSWLRARSVDGRTLADNLSWAFAVHDELLPFAFDLPIAVVRGSPDVAWQMLMLDAEAYAVTSLVNNLLFYTVRRGRPSSPDCAANPSYDPTCGMGSGSSFPSGHVVFAATGAGLTCVHHRYLPLYGNANLDAAACGVALVALTGTAVTRIVSDHHYATDTLVGAVIGLGGGYGIPWSLHYRTGRSRDARHHASLGSMFVMPMTAPGSLGLTLLATL